MSPCLNQKRVQAEMSRGTQSEVSLITESTHPLHKYPNHYYDILPQSLTTTIKSFIFTVSERKEGEGSHTVGQLYTV